MDVAGPELCESMNKEKAVFALVTVLFGFTGYRITTNALEMNKRVRALPTRPRAERVDLSTADEQLREDIRPRFFDTFWRFGARNPFQLPEAHVQAKGYFTLTELNGRIVVNGYYECKSDGPVDKVRITCRKQWTASAGSEEVRVRKRPSTRDLNVSEVTFEELQEGDFRVPINFTLYSRAPSTVRFPDIAMVDVTGEHGYIAIKSTETYKFKPNPSDGISKAAKPPRSLRKADVVYQYAKHPYRLTIGVARVRIATKPRPPGPRPPKPKPGTKPKPRPPKPGTKPKPPGLKPLPDENGGDGDAPPELPFTFKATIKVGKQFVVLEDKATGKLLRCVVGDTVNELTIVQINPTSVVFEDEQGQVHKLVDPMREKYD